MKKDTTITDFLHQIEPLMHTHNLQIVDHWKADLCAIGIQKESKLIYISTYNYLTESVVQYDFDLELIDDSDTTNSTIVKEGRKVAAQELIQELKTFFNI
ncbi:MAG: hypothetical protein AAF617_01185 [Bacteroidota bacterium]